MWFSDLEYKFLFWVKSTKKCQTKIVYNKMWRFDCIYVEIKEKMCGDFVMKCKRKRRGKKEMPHANAI